MQAKRQQNRFWVPAREAFWLALEELRNHKLRSFLTLLGVVIATTTLIVVMSVSKWHESLHRPLKSPTWARTLSFSRTFKWAQGYEAYLAALRRNRPVRLEEYDYLREALTGYEAMSAIAQPENGPSARASRAAPSTK